ncbi:cell death regulator Aven-like isoform X2 [Corticium candelabrum]|uniref:cell death regulator Aven-like isoform X2 n=1 Tax=Corticium candelabrum TaxID=121492 RepID=UPI002E26973B|nr:cell death regulator Aven-like isoform X2 [Corticium candelabrum]
MGKDRRRKQTDRKSQKEDKPSFREQKHKGDAQSQQSGRSLLAAEGAASAVSVHEGKSKEELKKGIGEQELDDHDSSSETMMNQTQRRYSRRKIVSNWERYDKPLGDEEDTASLASETSKLKLELAATTQSADQFAFHRESLWNSLENNQETVSPFVCVDCDKLAASIRSVPITQRLGLPTDSFDPSTLKAIESQPSQLVPNEPLRHKQPLPKEYELEYLKQYFGREQLQANEQKDHQNLDNTLQQNQISPQITQQQSVQLTNDAVDCNHDTATIQKAELDQPAWHHNEDTNLKPTGSDKPLEQDDSIRIHQAPLLEVHINEDSTQMCKSNETQELEDWLESVLD